MRVIRQVGGSAVGLLSRLDADPHGRQEISSGELGRDVRPYYEAVAEFLRHYIDWGLSKIVVIGHTERELGNAYGRELTYETVAARKGDEFVKVVLRQSVPYSPGSGGANVGKDSDTIISEQEYEKAIE